MSRRLNSLVAGLAVMALSVVNLLGTAQAQDGPWRIAKVSGEAWVNANGVQPASVSQQGELRPGDSVRTGRNGRVLLLKGAESILVSPNSAISLPDAGRPGMSSVIQQAGSILLDVEKRNVQHFEVETPYLAAVVKGTRFRVSIEGGRARVDVLRGQVQVADFRSGQFALVLPGQSARASFGQSTGLSLSGRGTPSSIEQGAPRAPSVAPIAVPGGGLTPPAGALPLLREAPGVASPVRSVMPAAASEDASIGHRTGVGGIERGPQGGLRISAPMGEVKLDIHKVTGGMARSEAQANTPSSARRATVWGTGELNPGNRSSKASAGNSGNPSGAAETQAGAAGAVGAATSSTPSRSAIARGDESGSNGSAIAAIFGGGPDNAAGTGQVGPENGRGNAAARGNDGHGNNRNGAVGPGNGRANGNSGNRGGGPGNGRADAGPNGTVGPGNGRAVGNPGNGGGGPGNGRADAGPNGNPGPGNARNGNTDPGNSQANAGPVSIPVVGNPGNGNGNGNGRR